MPKVRFHKLAALVVLVGFAAWVATGEFSSVGSAADPQKQDAAAEQEAEAGMPARTVAVVKPPRSTHARAIRISGVTEADKRAVLATRAGGVIARLPVRQGQRVKAGDLILMLDAEEKIAAADNARQLLTQRQAELSAAERLAKSGNLAKLQLDTARSNLTSARSALRAPRPSSTATRSGRRSTASSTACRSNPAAP